MDQNKQSMLGSPPWSSTTTNRTINSNTTSPYIQCQQQRSSYSPSTIFPNHIIKLILSECLKNLRFSGNNNNNLDNIDNNNNINNNNNNSINSSPNTSTTTTTTTSSPPPLPIQQQQQQLYSNSNNITTVITTTNRNCNENGESIVTTTTTTTTTLSTPKFYRLICKLFDNIIRELYPLYIMPCNVYRHAHQQSLTMDQIHQYSNTYSNIVYLSIRCCNKVEIGDVVSYLQCHPTVRHTLRHLDVGYNNLNARDPSMSLISTALEVCTRLCILELDTNALDTTDVMKFTNKLRDHKSLQCLFIGGNAICCHGLGSLITHTPVTLKLLWLNCTNPLNIDLSPLAGQLTNLSLAFNQLLHAGAQMIGQQIFKPGGIGVLRCLDLTHCTIQDDGLIELGNAIARSGSPNLRYLCLDFNAITNDGGDNFCRIVHPVYQQSNRHLHISHSLNRWVLINPQYQPFITDSYYEPNAYLQNKTLLYDNLDLI